MQGKDGRPIKTGRLHYHIEQQIDGYFDWLQNVVSSLEALKQKIDVIYSEAAADAEQEGKRRLVEDIPLIQKVIDRIYFGGVQIPFKKLSDAWQALTGKVRQNRDWWMLVSEDENFRQEFLQLTSTIQENLGKIRQAAESLFSYYPYKDDNQIQMVKKGILHHIDAAQRFISAVREYAEKEQQPERPSPVRNAIEAIRTSIRRLTRWGEKAAEEGNE